VRAGVPLRRDLILLATADEEAGSRFGAGFVVDQHRDWLDGAEYALSELGWIHVQPELAAPVGAIVVSEKTGLPLQLTARDAPGHGSMPWPTTAPNRLVRALGRLLDAEREPRVLPEAQAYFSALGRVLPPERGRGYADVTRSLRDPEFRARFLAHRQHAAMVRTTFAVTMLTGSEKRNVVPPEATAVIDCRLLAGDDPDEIVGWVRGVIDDDRVEVTPMQPPKRPNLSSPDTELYRALEAALRARVPGTLVTPQVLTGFTDNWFFRGLGLQAYGFAPFVLDEGEWRRVHGNDERVSLENLREGVRSYTEMLLAVAA